MGRVLVGLAPVACAALLLSAPASAGTLDQQQTSSNADSQLLLTQTLAQSFTAGITGLLDQADLDLSKAGTPPASVAVDIRNLSAGQPGTAVLASATIPTSSVGTSHAFVPFTFPIPAPVTAGTQYAIVAYSPGTSGNAVRWRDWGGDIYLAGLVFFNPASPPVGSWTPLSGEDLAFKTYVAPPLPTEQPLAKTGKRAAALKKCKKKHSKRARRKCRKKAKLLPV